MRINDKSLGGVERVSDAAKPKATQAVPEESTGSFVKVKVSAASQAASASVSQSTQARADRVQQIAQLVRSGAYPVDLNQLANSIASDELARVS